ncbi:hypothetical protein KI387_041649, partial [Taxus chinensis]
MRESLVGGILNYVPWKLRLQNILEETKLWYLVEKKAMPPTYPKDLVEYNKKVVKAKRIPLDLVKDRLIPHIATKKTAKEMYDALGTLYQSVNVSRVMLLRNKLNTTHMSKTDTMASYLMKLAELRDQIGAVGDEVKDNELVQIALNGFSPLWHNFVQ